MISSEKLKIILKDLFPPVVIKILSKFRKKTTKSYDYSFEKTHHNRLSILNRCLFKLGINCSFYLEVGLGDNFVFESIPLKNSNKFGVDPMIDLEPGVDVINVYNKNIFRLTSDDFFKINKQKFDLIFIDGLHHYEQVLKDLENSLHFLNDNGFVVIHDMIPRNESAQVVPRIQNYWTGDVWKLSENINETKGLEFIIADIDQGVGIIRKNKFYKKISGDPNKIKNLDYKYFREILIDKLPIKKLEDAFDFIDEK